MSALTSPLRCTSCRGTGLLDRRKSWDKAHCKACGGVGFLDLAQEFQGLRTRAAALGRELEYVTDDGALAGIRAVGPMAAVLPAMDAVLCGFRPSDIRSAANLADRLDRDGKHDEAHEVRALAKHDDDGEGYA